MTDELFTIPDSKPDALTAARNRLAKAQEEVERIEQIHEEQGTESAVPLELAENELYRARKAVAALETEALKSL